MLRFTLLCLCCLAPACRSLSAESITPNVERSGVRHGGFVRVETRGRGRIDGDALAEALRTGLAASGLFEGIVDAGGSWLLSVAVVDFPDPEWGLDVTAKVTMRWELRTSEGEVRWTESITTTHTATPEDTFAVGEREELAVQSATRENLKRGLERLATVDLAP